MGRLANRTAGIGAHEGDDLHDRLVIGIHPDHVFKALGKSALGGEQQSEGGVKRMYSVGREVSAPEADQVQPDQGGLTSVCRSVGNDLVHDHRDGADNCVCADTAELMDPGQPAQDRAVSYRDMGRPGTPGWRE